ncbi:MAG: hypothetical protein U0R71_11430 [Solirubrobacterales bacterium]
MNEASPGPALATVLRGSAVPYGYTLTVLAAHSIVTHRHGRPDVWDIGFFVIGALLAFATLGVLAQRQPRRALLADRPDMSQRDMIRVGMSHVFAIGAAFALTTAASLVHGRVAWALGAYVATVTYLTITSIEITVARRTEEGPGS